MYFETYNNIKACVHIYIAKILVTYPVLYLHKISAKALCMKNKGCEGKTPGRSGGKSYCHVSLQRNKKLTGSRLDEAVYWIRRFTTAIIITQKSRLPHDATWLVCLLLVLS
jgi:hypothetical protein